MENTIETPIMTTEELAAHLQLHQLTVRRLARSGEIPAFKVGRQWRIKRALLDAWLEQTSMENLRPKDDIAESEE